MQEGERHDKLTLKLTAAIVISLAAMMMAAIPASADSPPSEQRTGPLPGEIEVTETVELISPAEAGLMSADNGALAMSSVTCKEQTVKASHSGGQIRFKTSTTWCYQDNEIVNNPGITFAGTTHGGGYVRVWHNASRTGGGYGHTYHSDKGTAGFCIPGGSCDAGNDVLKIRKSQYADGGTTYSATYYWQPN